MQILGKMPIHNFFARSLLLKKLLLCGVVFLFFFNPAFGKEIDLDKYGGELVMATTSDPRSFNPIMAQETSTTAVTGFIFEGLTRTNGVTLEVEPNLAKSWEVSPDGLEWIFHLRGDVYWADGHPFTAEDVVFTFNDLIYNEKIPSSSRDSFTIDGKIFKVEEINDFTVKFTLPVKFAPFLRSMSQEILPRHKLQNAVKEEKFTFTWGIDTDPKDIIGTGPYQLAQYIPGQRVVFKRNSLYWRKSKYNEQLPYIDKVIFLIVQSQDIILLKFLDGELDYCSVRGADYPLLKPEEKKRNFFIYDGGPDFGSNFLVFNQNRDKNPKTGKPYLDPVNLAWFTNLDFRRAVAHAVDKKKIIDILMNGLGYPQDSSMSPSSGFFYHRDVANYDYDLQKAKQILNRAGFEDRDGNGILEDAQGNDVEFNLYTNAGVNERIQIGSIIRHDLSEIGIKVNFLAIEFNDLVAKLTSAFDWDAVIIGLTGGIEPHFGKNVWASDGGLHMWHPRQKTPATEWEKRIDEIFSLGVQELNEKKRKVLYDEWQVIVSKELPLIYTVLGANMFAIRDKFENLHPTSYGGVFHNLEEVYIRKEFR